MNELIAQRLCRILRTRQYQEDALTGEVLNTDGNVVSISGKVVRCDSVLTVLAEVTEMDSHS